MKVPSLSDLQLPLLIYARARGLNYTSQFLLLNSLVRLMPGNKKVDPPDFETFEILRNEAEALLKSDVDHIAEGVYPVSVLKPESPIEHLKRIPKIIWDGLNIQRRRGEGRTTVFTKEATEYLDDVPRYYRRNFHFQSDGYLSQKSAKLYDHQVEILFGGMADPMRRMIISPMKKHFKNSDGKGLTFLEIAAGTGSATRFVKLAFPKAKIVVLDLSEPYLKEAQGRLKKFSKMDYVQADGGKLPFTENTFDAVYSVFLFHELPEEARQAVFEESLRVLKPGGFVGAVDSIQYHDFEPARKLLDAFPQNYHEPFYRNYVEHPLEDLVKAVGFSQVDHGRAYVSKWCSGVKASV